MRLIGELTDSNLAERFAAYLMTESITPKIEEEGGLFEVWVKEEDEQQRAAEELAKFQQDPHNSRYQGVIEKAAEISRAEEKKRRQFQKNVVKVNQRSVGRRAPLTTLLIVLCVIVALMTNFGDTEKGITTAMRALSFTSLNATDASPLLEHHDVEDSTVRLASIMKGQVWRLITPIFIHFGVWHILFNMLWLFQFGKQIENRYGTFWFAVLVIATALFSNLLQCLVPDQVGGSVPGLAPSGELIMLSGGMSGVVYGLFGFIWVKFMYDPKSRLFLPQSTVVILVAWLFLGRLFVPNIANWAHGVGLAVGMLAGFLPINLDRGRLKT